MEWLIHAAKEPVVELLKLLALGALTALTARIRASQKRAHQGLRDRGVLPPKP